MATALAGLGAALGLAVLAVILWVLFTLAVVSVSEVRRKGYPVKIAMVAAVNYIFTHYWHKLPIPSGPTLPESGAALLVGPHRCSLDPFLLHAHATRRVYFLVAKEYTLLPVLDGFFKLIEFIPVDRAMDVAPSRPRCAT